MRKVMMSGSIFSSRQDGVQVQELKKTFSHQLTKVDYTATVRITIDPQILGNDGFVVFSTIKYDGAFPEAHVESLYGPLPQWAKYLIEYPKWILSQRLDAINFLIDHVKKSSQYAHNAKNILQNLFIIRDTNIRSFIPNYTQINLICCQSIIRVEGINFVLKKDPLNIVGWPIFVAEKLGYLPSVDRPTYYRPTGVCIIKGKDGVDNIIKTFNLLRLSKQTNTPTEKTPLPQQRRRESPIYSQYNSIEKGSQRR